MLEIRHVLPALMVLAFAGCSDSQDTNKRPVFPATGTVTYRGKPLVDATVRLHPLQEDDDDRPVWLPRGRVNSEGRFTLSTYRTGDGAPAGEYRVSFSWQGPLKNISEDDQDELPELMPKQLTSPKHSNITVVVAEGENEFAPFDFN